VSYKLNGKVLNQNGSSIEGYNVMLLNPNDSSVYKADFFMDVNYSIETPQLPVLLNVSSFGFNDTIIFVEKFVEQLPVIYLSQHSFMLDEVVVQTKTPLLSVKSDRMTMNVASTSLKDAGSAIDILQKSARIKITDNDISVLGVGNALILVDGREIPSNQVLEMLSSSEIQKIDIITNPSSKYDAKGKAVIEIRTKKAQEQGVGAEVTERIGKGTYWNNYFGTEITAKTSQFSLYAFYAHNLTKRQISENYTRDYTEEISPYYIKNEIKTINHNPNNHRIRLSGNYILSDKHQIGLQLGGQFSDGKNKKNNMNQVFNSNETIIPPLLEIASIQKTNTHRNYLTGTAYYSYLSSPEGTSINVVVDKSNFNTKSNSLIDESANQLSIDKSNHVKTAIDITSFNVDASIPLLNGYKIETGIKYTFIENESKTKFLSNTYLIRDINYNYKEKLGALYFLLSKKFGRIDSEIGTRMEMTDNYAKAENEIIQNITDYQFFPSLSLSYNITPQLDLNFFYAMKISRPSFQDMNPAIDYIDSLSYFQGNPSLKPEIRHQMTLKLAYLKMAILGFSYIRKNNVLAWYIEPDESNALITKATQKNIDQSDVLSIDAVLPYQNKLGTYYLATGLIYNISNDKNSNIKDMKHPMWYAYSGIDIKLPYNIKFTTSIQYFTKGIENIFYFDPVFRMDMGLNKTLMNKKLEFGLMWNDIFKSDKMNTYTTINTRSIYYNYYYDVSIVNLTVSYKFNTKKSKENLRSTIESERQRIKDI
jgi:hypothetical protein